MVSIYLFRNGVTASRIIRVFCTVDEDITLSPDNEICSCALINSHFPLYLEVVCTGPFQPQSFIIIIFQEEALVLCGNVSYGFLCDLNLVQREGTLNLQDAWILTMVTMFFDDSVA